MRWWESGRHLTREFGPHDVQITSMILIETPGLDLECGKIKAEFAAKHCVRLPQYFGLIHPVIGPEMGGKDELVRS